MIADAGSGQITVTAGTGFIRATDDALDTLLYFDFPNLTATTITDQTVRYVGRGHSAAPAVGYYKLFLEQQRKMILSALSLKKIA